MTDNSPSTKKNKPDDNASASGSQSAPKPAEKGGPKGPDPVRYGDWEIGGKCVDF